MPDSGKFYMLVNPYIEGSMQKIFKANNSSEASKQAYETISKYFNNEVPNFNFSLLKLKSNELDSNNLNKLNLENYGTDASNKYFNKNNFSHFTVNEQRKKNNEVSFQINKFEGNVQDLNPLIKNIITIQKKYKSKQESNQSGGSSAQDSSYESQSSGSDSYESSSSQSGGSKSDSESGSESKSDKHSHRKSKYDDDDDDSPDYYVKKYYYDPILYWYYAPALYGTNSFYFPMFNGPISAPVFLDTSYPLGPLFPTMAYWP